MGAMKYISADLHHLLNQLKEALLNVAHFYSLENHKYFIQTPGDQRVFMLKYKFYSYSTDGALVMYI